jgi:dTDP-4-dehydrorhamnose reductase
MTVGRQRCREGGEIVAHDALPPARCSGWRRAIDMQKTVLVAGAGGFVGRQIAAFLRSDHHVVGLGRGQRSLQDGDLREDLADPACIDRRPALVRPDVIVHAAGNKNLAECAHTPNLAWDSNVRSVEHLRRAFPDVPLIYISTDYVFRGADGGYEESSATSPSTAYGQSKLCGELAGRLVGAAPFTAVRVSALYASDAAFLTFLDRELSNGRAVECFTDAHYSPTFRDDLMGALAWLLDADGWPAILHVCGERVSRYEFARTFAAVHGFDSALVLPTTLDRPAIGPLFPDLSMSCATAHRLFGFVPTAHEIALAQLHAKGVVHARSRAVPPVQ